MTHDTWFGVNILLKFQLSISNELGEYYVVNIGRKRITDQLNYSVTKVFVEQPRLHQACLIIYILQLQDIPKP